MNSRLAIALSGVIIASVGATTAAQDESGGRDVDTYCLTVEVPAGTVVDESDVFDDPSIVTILELLPCGDGDASDDGVDAPVTLGRWTLEIKNVNDSAWKVLKKDNSSKTAPPRGSRIVMVAINIGHDERGMTYYPAADIEYTLFGPDDSMEEYGGVLPQKTLFGLDAIPGGRSKTFMAAWIVPGKVRLEDLVLYLEGDMDYAEIALGD